MCVLRCSSGRKSTFDICPVKPEAEVLAIFDHPDIELTLQFQDSEAKNPLSCPAASDLCPLNSNRFILLSESTSGQSSEKVPGSGLD